MSLAKSAAQPCPNLVPASTQRASRDHGLTDRTEKLVRSIQLGANVDLQWLDIQRDWTADRRPGLTDRRQTSHRVCTCVPFP